MTSGTQNPFYDMTTGNNQHFYSLPSDINTPKPSYFYNVFWMIHSYINLILNTPDTVTGEGIVKLYSYRMGVLNPDTSVLEATYIQALEKGQRKLRNTLNQFAHSMISYNLATLYRLLNNTLKTDIAKGYGDYQCLTADTLSAIYEFCKFHKTKRSPKDTRYDSINSLVSTCNYNAVYYTPGLPSIAEIISLLETIDILIQSPLGEDEYDRRNTMMNLLRVVFYIGCRYYRVNVLRFNDQHIKRPYTRNIGINNFTLAAIPFDPMMIYSCTDEDGAMSRFGVEYIQSLHAVLSPLGGVECTVNYSALAPTNKE